MPRPKGPIPSPLDAVQKMLETGAVGGGGRKPETPEEEAPGQQGNTLPGQPGNMATGYQGNRVTWQPGNRMPGQQDARATGQPGNTLPGQQGNRVTGQARISRAGWQPQTMYLPGDLRKWLKLESVMQDKEIGEIVTEILREHLARRG